MSQRKTRGTQATNLPNSATATTPAPMSSNPKATLPTALANVAIPRNSNLLAVPVEVAEREDLEEIRT